MGLVIGPFDRGDFITMHHLRAEMNALKNDELMKEKYKPAIRKLRKCLKEYMTREAA